MTLFIIIMAYYLGMITGIALVHSLKKRSKENRKMFNYEDDYLNPN